MALQRAVYRPRDAEHAVLHEVIAEHLEAFLRAVAEAGAVVALTCIRHTGSMAESASLGCDIATSK